MSIRPLPVPLRPVRLARPALPRPIRPVIRTLPITRRLSPVFDIAGELGQPEPYEDYGRRLTREGGILIFYKDLDLRIRQYAWRILAWSAFTGAEAWYLAGYPNRWVHLLCLLAIGIANWLVVRTPSECHRSIEIRADCLIIEGADVFWRRYMDAGPPAFQADAEGNQQLCAIYGTRLVELLTVRRFDEFDRTPEVIAAHLEGALTQLWAKGSS